VAVAVQALLAAQGHPAKVLRAALPLQIPTLVLAAVAALLRLALTVQVITAVTVAQEPHPRLLAHL